MPPLGRKRAHFLSLEAFNLQGYDKVVYVDSDALIVGNVSDLFSAPGDLAACPDMALARGLVRDRRTFRLVSPAAVPRDTVFTRSFNSGVLSIGKPLLSGETFGALERLVTEDVLAPVETGHTDQFVLNTHFDRSVSLLPRRFNYLVNDGHRRAALGPGEARIVHYAGRPKPWQRGWLGRIVRGERTASALAPWLDAYERYLRHGPAATSPAVRRVRLAALAARRAALACCASVARRMPA